MAAEHPAPTKKYWAFISYSSKDKRWGKWLHQRLENYPIPPEFHGTEIFDGAVLGKNLRPIFRDRDELAGSAELGPAILKGLRDSRFLIALCSPNSATSQWVDREISDFKALDPENEKRILALILDGTPNATSSPEVDTALECFPPSLRLPAEPLAGDLRKNGDGKERGFLKILSGVSQLDFDTLYRRHERAQRRKRLALAVFASIIILSLGGLTAFAFHQKSQADEQRNRANQQKVFADQQRAVADQQKAIAVEQEAIAVQQKTVAVHRHAETLYRQGLDASARDDSLSALGFFVRALEERPDWTAPRAHCTELIARRYWPIAEKSVNLHQSDDDDYFLRTISDSILLASSGPLLLSSPVGLRAIDLDSGESEALNEEDVASRLSNGPFLDREFTHFKNVRYRWDDNVALGITAKNEAFLFRLGGKMLQTAPLDNTEGLVLGYDPEARQLRIAALTPEQDEVIISSYEAQNEMLVLASTAKHALPDPSSANDSYPRSFTRDGSRVFVARTNDLLIIGGDDAVDLPIARVERIAASPSGRHVAILRSKAGALHGESNLLLSILTLEDFESFQTGSFEDVNIPPLTSISQSEEVPLRNALMGYSGKWYQQGFSEIHFLSNDRLVLISGHQCHIFRIWDRRAIPEAYEVSIEDEVERETSAPPGVTLKNDGAYFSRDGKSHIFREAYPITQAQWLGDSNHLATASFYKFYGSAASIWDAETGTRLVGPIEGRVISPATTSDTLSLVTYGFSTGFIGYRREATIPTKTSRWLVELGSAIAQQDFGAIPSSALVPATLPPSEKELAARLLSTSPLEDLPLQVGTSRTRREWREIYLPLIQTKLTADN